MGFLKGGKFGKPLIPTETKEEVQTTKPAPLKLKGLKKPLIKTDVAEVKEEVINEEKKPLSSKPKLGLKKPLSKVVEEPKVEEPKVEEIKEVEETKVEETKIEETKTIKEEPKEIKLEEKLEETVAEETTIEEKPKKKKSSRKKATKNSEQKNDTVASLEVEIDESKRVSLEEMDDIMRPIIAPTTEKWEKEKEDVLNALKEIRIEQDMTISQVKAALSSLDNLRLNIFPVLLDTENSYSGFKQNYEAVKAMAISKGNGTNAEARKAEGILACQNFVAPGGEVVNLQTYKLLIDERYNFYQKAMEAIEFKKYSLVNYNSILKMEAEL